MEVSQRTNTLKQEYLYTQNWEADLARPDD